MYLVRVSDEWIDAVNLDGIRFIGVEDNKLKLDFPWSSSEIRFKTKKDAVKALIDILTAPESKRLIVFERKDAGFVRSSINKLKELV